MNVFRMEEEHEEKQYMDDAGSRLIILLLCLGLPLISVLAPTFTAGQYPLSAYVEFFRMSITEKFCFAP